MAMLETKSTKTAEGISRTGFFFYEQISKHTYIRYVTACLDSNPRSVYRELVASGYSWLVVFYRELQDGVFGEGFSLFDVSTLLIRLNYQVS